MVHSPFCFPLFSFLEFPPHINREGDGDARKENFSYVALSAGRRKRAYRYGSHYQCHGEKRQDMSKLFFHNNPPFVYYYVSYR